MNTHENLSIANQVLSKLETISPIESRKHRGLEQAIPISAVQAVASTLNLQYISVTIKLYDGRTLSPRIIKTRKSSNYSTSKEYVYKPKLHDNQIIFEYKFDHTVTQPDEDEVSLLCRLIGMHIIEAMRIQWIIKATNSMLSMQRAAHREEINYRTNITTKRDPSNVNHISQPGTHIQRGLRLLHTGLAPSRSAYVVIDGNQAYVEYLIELSPKSSKSRIISGVNNFKLPEDFLKTAASNRIFEWRSPLLIPEYLNYQTKPITYLIQPFHDQLNSIRDEVTGIAVGANIFEYRGKQTDLTSHYKEVLTNSRAFLQDYAKYLYQRRTNNMIVNPHFLSRDTRIKENSVFTLMPFKSNWSDDVWTIIQDVVTTKGFSATRADLMHGDVIMEDIWEGILQAKFIVADITSRNANVFYELGIAHTLGKHVILMTQSTKEIPFDLTSLRHIVYTHDVQGANKLRKQLTAKIDQILANDNIK